MRLTADITPSYAGLSAERLAGIRSGFVQRGVRPVAVYLMRDPVERVWSAVRMDVRRSGNTADDAVEARLRTIADGDQYDRRTRYDLTMATVDRAFGDEVFYGFYERLFDESTLRELCGFLGIDFVEPDVGRQVNVSPKEGGDLADDIVRALVARFAPVYAAVADRFPEVDLPSLWPSARYL